MAHPDLVQASHLLRGEFDGEGLHCLVGLYLFLQICKPIFFGEIVCLGADTEGKDQAQCSKNFSYGFLHIASGSVGIKTFVFPEMVVNWFVKSNLSGPENGLKTESDDKTWRPHSYLQI